MIETIKNRIDNNRWFFGLWAGIASFLSYFCMYMYRKPYTSATFESYSLYETDYKTLLVIAQILGYTCSKFIGIKFISELKPNNRITQFLFLVTTSLLSLVGFAFTTYKLGPMWLFLNGLPLGMIWGIVFSYCEGRSLTELLAVFISANYILSSGIAKTFGRLCLSIGIPEQQMPMYVGLCTIPLLLLSLWMLSIIPPPSKTDVEKRTSRKLLNAQNRRELITNYKIYILLFVLLYITLTVIRDIRDNFSFEIWHQLGYGDTPSILTESELPITIFILFALGIMFKIHSNQKALQVGFILSSVGALLLLSSTLMFFSGFIGPVWWMILNGTGLFIPYILMNGIIFDRFIAHFRISANVGFFMYIIDALGYLATVFVLIIKNFLNVRINWLDFFQWICISGGILSLLATVTPLIYFSKDSRNEPTNIMMKKRT